MAKAEKLAIKELSRQSRQPVQLPTPDAVTKLVTGIEAKLLSRDVGAARELLRRLFKNGEIRLSPGPDGVYTATSRVLPLVLLAETEEAPGVRGLFNGFRSGGGI